MPASATTLGNTQASRPSCLRPRGRGCSRAGPPGHDVGERPYEEGLTCLEFLNQASSLKCSVRRSMVNWLRILHAVF
jgi:hypothetical protein